MFDSHLLRARLLSDRDAILESLRRLVEHESPSRVKPALDPLASELQARLEAVGVEVDRVPNASGGDHLIGRYRGGSAPAIVVVGHFDTVWPSGTLESMPFRIAGDRAFGPGIYDMKAGFVILERALAALREFGIRPAGDLRIVWTSDEEIGSPTSRGLIEEIARQCAAALVLEPPLAGGRLKTARKGVGQYALEVEGKSAHAGVEPEKGVNAIVELAHQILEVCSFARPDLGTTLNVGTIEGGTTSNVVPASASAVVDVRIATTAEATRITERFGSLAAKHPGAKLVVRGGINRPPMERTPRIAELLERAREIARPLGIALEEGSTGGGSDGNFTAAVGTPTLDGLGVDGEGAHAPHESILIPSLLERILLLTALLAGLDMESLSHE
ncbi:MAG: M20 family metallopeptidase [Isosphaeraceae bacterium]|nr:M20 family metallopeptidase [Isosphaeraceae bacterium]